jgi:hypothetical protein
MSSKHTLSYIAHPPGLQLRHPFENLVLARIGFWT